MDKVPPLFVNNHTSVIDIGGRMNTTIGTTTDPWADDYFVAGAILFPTVIILVIANILMFAAVLDMLVFNKAREPISGAVLMLSLAISDIMIGIASIISISEAGNHDNNDNICYTTIGFMAMSVMASCLVMMCIAMERYITVRKPFRNTKNDTRKVIAVTIAIWTSSALVGFAPLMGWRNENPRSSVRNCNFLLAVPGSYIIFVFFGMYLPTLTVTSYFHIVMCQASREQGRKIAACEIFGTQSAQRSKSTNDVKDVEIKAGRPVTMGNKVEISRRCSLVFQPEQHTPTVAFAVASELVSTSLHGDRLSKAKPFGLPGAVTRRLSSAPSSYSNRRIASNSSHLPKLLDTLKPMKWSRTVILILGFFICMWMPFWIACLTQTLCNSCDLVDLACSYLMVLGVANSAVNPMVYISTDKRLKEHFCQCFFRPEASTADESSSVFLQEEGSEDN